MQVYSAEEDFKFKEEFKSKDDCHVNKGLNMHMNKQSSHNYNRCEEEFKSSSMHMKPGMQGYHDGGLGHGLEKHHGHHDGGFGHGHHDGYSSHSESWSFEKEKHHDGYSGHGGKYGGYGGYGGMGHKVGGYGGMGHKVGGYGGYGEYGAPHERVEEHQYRYYSEQRKGRPVWDCRAIRD